MHLCLIDWVVHLPSIYMHCPRSSSGCSSMQGIYAEIWMTGGPSEGSISSIYMHCPRSSSGCSGMQDICAWLTGEGHMKCNGIQCIYARLTGRSICLLYICIVLDLVMGLTVCKTSVLNWLGTTYAGLHCAIFGAAVFKASMLDWLGWSICLLYICIVLDLSMGLVVCKTSMLDWLGRATWSVMVFKASMPYWLRGSICLLYICIVLDLAFGCSGMLGICAWLTE